MAYPHVPLRLRLKAQQALPSLAKDFSYEGEITLKNTTGQTWAVIPIEATIY